MNFFVQIYCKYMTEVELREKNHNDLLVGTYCSEHENERKIWIGESDKRSCIFIFIKFNSMMKREFHSYVPNEYFFNVPILTYFHTF
jgi:hypothetical protein